jgi:coenzyme Q-binding protein COQ10
LTVFTWKTRKRSYTSKLKKTTMKSISPVTTSILQNAVRPASRSCRAAFLANDTTTRQRRTFLPNPFTPNQTLTATRTLRYPTSVVYDIISDVDSYHKFLPFCQGSQVTKTSHPASDGKCYPEEAKLLVGFNGDISEEFTSRIYCVPNRIVEAVSGNTNSTLPSAEISHHNERPPEDQDPSRKSTVMAQLLTRWTLKGYPYKPPPVGAVDKDATHKNHDETNPLPGQEKTEVNLTIEYKFSNPLYAALSSAAAPKVADKMIEAFENRVKAVLEGPAYAKTKRQSTKA